MKIIKLFLLLPFGLWAEFKLDIPNTIDVSQLENIVNNGWNDSNITLNDFIVTNVERVMPEILKKIEKPVLKGLITLEEPYPVSNLILAKDDYLLMVSYIKYLEYNQKSDEAKSLYINLFEGLSHIDDKSFLAMLARMVNEEIVTNGLLEGLRKNHYSDTMKRDLRVNLKPVLLKDYEIYYLAVEYERESVLKIVKRGLLKKSRDDTVGYTKFMTEVYKSFEKNLNTYFDKMIFSIKKSMKDNNKKALDDFSLYIKDVKEKHMSFNNQVKLYFFSIILKIKNILGIGNSSKGFVSAFMGKTNALVAVPKLPSSSLDYVDLVKKNTQLLIELER